MSLTKSARWWAAVAVLCFAGCSPSSKDTTSTGRRSSLPPPSPAEAPSALDWPQWRHDANRSANADFELPEGLQLQWTRHFSPRVQTWDDPLNNDLIAYDRVFEPVVHGNRMFVAFNDSDKVVSLDVVTGQEVWAFYTEGPVRLPPCAWEGKVYFCSDDGWLYCVRARDGGLVWKFRGGPADRKALGNRRLVSTWPARGGPVARDGQVYFAASIWPFMGVFLYALDARDGSVTWVNDGAGPLYHKQPHSAPSFAGVAPQGPLVATAEYLLTPGGRSVPAAFSRATGKFLHYQLEDSGKGNGGSFVAASETEFFVHTRERGVRAFELKTGKKTTFTLNEPVVTTNRLYSAQEFSSLKAAVVEAEQKLNAAIQGKADALTEVARTEEEGDRPGYKKATNTLASALRKVGRAETALLTAQTNLGANWAGCVIQAVGNDKKVRWELPADGTGDLIKAGRRLYAAGTNGLLAVELPATNGQPPRLVWSNAVSGRVLRLLAAQNRLFAVTADGAILCFGAGRKRPVTFEQERGPLPAAAKGSVAADLAASADARQGYAILYGVGDGQLLEGLLRHTELRVAAVDPESATMDALRRHYDRAGLYGARVSLHQGDPLSFRAPPYIANLVILNGSMTPRLSEAGLLAAAYSSVRPYGGWLWIAPDAANDAGISKAIEDIILPQARLERAHGGRALVRAGPLPGAADWTHQYGDAANTLKSDDSLVRLPLGLLWFGGPSHDDVLPRHGHGPSEQVSGGRLFIEGMSWLSARDVYTGRVLWKTDFGDLGNHGIYYDSSYTNTPLSIAYNQKHIPGANARGANFVATADALYVVVSNTCRVLDARTGQPLRVIAMPSRPEETESPAWGYIGVFDDVLLGGAGFGHYTTRFGLSTNRNIPIVDYSGSRGLVAFNRHTGWPLWRSEARHSFLHNGIAVGGGRVYCLDKLPKSAEDKLKRRGRTPEGERRLAAFDARTGRLLWEKTTNVFGTWLSYSREHDILVQAGAKNTDRLKDEASQGMIAYRGADGAVLWKNLDLKYDGPVMLHRELIITAPASYKTNAGAFGLRDGKPLLLANPLTGQPEPLRVYRAYGCNHAVACENLITFRSGAAGFYDLENHGGTGNLGGFKSACSANLIAADGVLNAPDYTRTCSCPYQNQTSLGLVHMPDSEQELWTHIHFGVTNKPGVRLRRVALNFGAPGDRLAPDGALWLDYPSVGGVSPYVYVSTRGSVTNTYRRHHAQFEGDGPAWVMASGLVGEGSLYIGLETTKAPPRPPPAPKKKTDDDDDDDDDDDLNGNGATNGVAGAVGATNSAAASVSATNKVTAQATNTATNKVVVVYKPVLPPAEFTVRLYFAEPEPAAVGERVFDVELQGCAVLKDFDVAREAGGARKGVIKEFQRIRVTDLLSLSLIRSPSASRDPILSGIEAILETAPPAAGAASAK